MKETLSRELRLIFNSKEQSGNGKRITCLDMVRGIAIFLVVMGHSDFVSHSCNVWLSSFHLPAFFFISGILMQLKKEDRRPMSDTILHKIKGIMVPYLWFSLAALGIDFVQLLRGKFTWSVLREHAIQTISLQGYSVLWFLPVLFFAELLLVWLYKAFKLVWKSPYSIAFTAIFLTCCSVGCYYGYQLLMHSSMPLLLLDILRIFVKAVIAAAFMSYGYLLGDLFPRKASAFRKIYIFLTGAAIFAVNVALVPCIQLMDFNHLDLGNPLVYLTLGTTGSVGCLLLCMSLPNIPIITFYGQNSLIIMCTHLHFYVLYMGMIMSRFLLAPFPQSGRIIYGACSLACTMLLLIPIILVIRIFFPFVLGRKLLVVRKKRGTEIPLRRVG